MGQFEAQQRPLQRGSDLRSAELRSASAYLQVIGDRCRAEPCATTLASCQTYESCPKLTHCLQAPLLDPARLLVTVVIPCHDEIEALPALFEELRSLPRLLHPSYPELVFIDDGSTDGTVHALQDFAAQLFFSCKVLGLSPCAGIGNALREAAPHVAGDVVVTYDADRPYPLADAARLVAVLAEGADVVTASPYVAGGSAPSVPFGRLLLSRAASGLYRLRLIGRRSGIHTFTCGFRAWRKAAYLESLPVENGFAATAEMLVNAIRAGRKVAEVPSTLRPREAGASKMRALPAALRHLRVLWRGAPRHRGG